MGPASLPVIPLREYEMQLTFIALSTIAFIVPLAAGASDEVCAPTHKPHSTCDAESPLRESTDTAVGLLQHTARAIEREQTARAALNSLAAEEQEDEEEAETEAEAEEGA